VLRVGGFLFLTFPYMSPLRRRKAVKGEYEEWINVVDEPDGFYQFALDYVAVLNHFKEVGFELCSMKGIDAVKGFKDESQLMRQTVQKMYDSSGFVSKATKYLWNKLFLHLSGHSCLLILKKI